MFISHSWFLTLCTQSRWWHNWIPYNPNGPWHAADPHRTDPDTFYPLPCRRRFCEFHWLHFHSKLRSKYVDIHIGSATVRGSPKQDLNTKHIESPNRKIAILFKVRRRTFMMGHCPGHSPKCNALKGIKSMKTKCSGDLPRKWLDILDS